MKKEVVTQIILQQFMVWLDKAEAAGVKIITGTEVTGFKRGSNSKAVTGVETSKGTIDCEQVVVGTGPWVKNFWDMLDLPNKISIKDKKGVLHDRQPYVDLLVFN